jgi:trehalose-6-phosphatase
MKQNKKLTIAVDFDGTLCEYAFPNIGVQTKEQKKLMEILIELRNDGNKLILYTCRGDNEEYPCLTEAIEWCKEKGLEFDSINCNVPGFVKKSGHSPKPVADIYLDDKALNVKDWRALLSEKKVD